MTVSTTASRTVYVGNGSTTVFPFAFKVMKPADLAVVFTDATGTDFTLSPAVYAATGFGQEAGGAVTYPLSGSPIAAGTKLTLLRSIAATQPTQLSNQGALWPSAIEGALDRVVMIVQGFIDAVNRTLRITATDGLVLSTLPDATTRANSVLGFDAQGQPYAATLTGSLVPVATWLVQNFLEAGTSQAAARSALGALALADLAAGQTVAATGSYALPGGLVVKWGTTASIGAGSNATVTFATAFPAVMFGALLVPLANSNGYASDQGAASFRVNNGGANAASFFWFAIGN
jgi:hypothetical protein